MCKLLKKIFLGRFFDEEHTSVVKIMMVCSLMTMVGMFLSGPLISDRFLSPMILMFPILWIWFFCRALISLKAFVKWLLVVPIVLSAFWLYVGLEDCFELLMRYPKLFFFAL